MLRGTVFSRNGAYKGTTHPYSKFLIEFPAISQILPRLVHRQFSGVLDDARLLGRRAVQVLNLTYNFHAFKNCTEHNMTAIEMRCGYCGNEELTAVCVFFLHLPWKADHHA